MASTFHLERVDSVPLEGNPLTFELRSWLATLVDSLNTTIQQIEDLLLEVDNYLVIPTVVTTVTATATPNSTIVIGNALQTTITLPDTAEVGNVVNIIGNGAGGWVLQPGTGQTIQVIAATANTSITSAERYDTISVVCVVADTTWVSFSSQTTGFAIL